MSIEAGTTFFQQRTERLNINQGEAISRNAGRMAASLDSVGVLTPTAFADRTADQQTRANNNARYIIVSLGHGYGSVEDMVNTSRDMRGKTEEQRNLARQDLLALSLALIQYGANFDPEWAKKLALSSPSTIKDSLPPSLRGIEGIVSTMLYNDPAIRNRVAMLEMVRNGVKWDNATSVNTLLTMDTNLMKWLSEDEKGMTEDGMLLFAYINQESVELAEKIEAINGAGSRRESSREEVTLTDEEKKRMEGMTEKQKEDFLRVKRELAKRKFNREYPDDPDGMTERAREILDFLEGTSYHSNEINISGETTRILNRMMAEADKRPELAGLKREIMTRLCLHDTAIFMAQAYGSFSDKGGYSVSRAVGDINSNDRFLQRDHLRLLFEEGIDGIPFAQAWDLLQLANFDYYGLEENEKVEKEVVRDVFPKDCVLLETKKMLVADAAKAESEEKRKKIEATIKTIDERLFTGWTEYEDDGVTVKKKHPKRERYNPFDEFYDPKFGNYQNEQNDHLKAAVKEYLTRRLMAETGADRTKAEKGLQLAQKFVFASDEASVLNYAYAYGDNFSELIQFGRFREDENKHNKGKPAGAVISRGRIKSINPGWLRHFCEINDPDLMVTSKTIVDHLKNLEGKNVWSGYHGSFLFPKFIPAYRDLMSAEVFKPEDVLNPNFLRQHIDPFNKADPKGLKALRVYWIAGVLQNSLEQYGSAWGGREVERLKDLVLNQPISMPDSKGKSEKFLTPEQWDWIVDSLNESGFRIQRGLAGLFKRLGGKRK